MKNISASLGILFLFSCLMVTAFGAEKHWAYQDSATETGPERWGTLPGDELCASGKSQTPINLFSSASVNAASPPLEAHYRPSAIHLINNGHTIQMSYEPGSTLSIGAKKFQLLQFHFHAPSEHSIDGKFSMMELHLVHADSAGKPAAVIAVLINEGKHNVNLDPILANAPRNPGEKKELSEKFDASFLLPPKSSYYFYSGSLTTPPCSEGIQWFVLKSPIEMDQAQIEAFTGVPVFNRTARPLKPIGGRQLQQSNF